MNKKTSFRHPPVVETVIGAQFEPLPKMTNAHLGAFWKTLGPDWPNVTDAPRIEDQFERFGAHVSWGGIQFMLTQNLSERLRIRNLSEDRMVQIQNCRIDYNWLSANGRPYPRYTSVRPEFDAMLTLYEGFIRSAGLGDLKPTQWEITYVNHILKGPIWQEPKDWTNLFSHLPGPCDSPRTGLSLEGLAGSWHFEIAPQRGRLHVDMKNGRLPDQRETLVVTLTARGPVEPEPDMKTALNRGLSLGHDKIVEGFMEMTSQAAHEYWNRPS